MKKNSVANGFKSYRRRNADDLSCDRRPPDHQVGVECDPDDAAEERDHEELAF